LLGEKLSAYIHGTEEFIQGLAKLIVPKEYSSFDFPARQKSGRTT